MSVSEELACLERLEELESDINDILDLFNDRQQLFGTDKNFAQEMLRTLKKKLKDEYQRTSSVKSCASLNPTEQAFYAPAIHEAFTSINVKTNSKPDSKWISDLYDAADSIHFYAYQLQK